MLSKRHFLTKSLAILGAGLVLAACQTPPAGHAGLSAAQVAALEQEGFHIVDDGMQLDLSGRLLFALDSSTTSPEIKTVVTKMTTVLLTVGVNRVRLDGHTDNVGNEAYNMQLSEKRAQSVAALMEETGFNPAAIQVRGLGPTRPIADNATEEGRAMNRRVSVIVSNVN
ncbi:OmpA family protein [Lampropedia puyangensis]|uniref:OmpA family protein n=1 Tax=Lampropedia puyangensis TaxID=1330072 RepID=UPI001FCE621B|nr:OmpA family protein [Lampropedia puyangensis]